jgi:integrase
MVDGGVKLTFKTKTQGKSRRTIAISPSTALVLRQHKEAEEAKRQGLGQTLTDNDYVFCRYDGQPYRPDSITHAFSQLAKRCGLDGIHLHSARHTMASLMLKLNVHPLTVSRMLGHSNIQTTLNIYSHLSLGIEAAAAARLDELISNGHRGKAKIEAIT